MSVSWIIAANMSSTPWATICWIIERCKFGLSFWQKKVGYTKCETFTKSMWPYFGCGCYFGMIMILQTKLIGDMLQENIAGGNKFCWLLEWFSIGSYQAKATLVTHCNVQLIHEIRPTFQLEHSAISGLFYNEMLVAVQLKIGY